MDQFLDVVGALQVAVWVLAVEGAAVAVGVVGVLDAQDLGAADAPTGVPGQAHAQSGTSTVTVAQGDDLLGVGVGLSQHDGRLVGLRAAVGEEALLQLSRRDLGHLFGQVHHVGMRVEGGSVLQGADLFANSLRDLRVAVAHTDSEDTAKEVQILLAVHTVQILPLSSFEGQRLFVVSDDTGENVLPLFLHDVLSVHC